MAKGNPYNVGQVDWDKVKSVVSSKFSSGDQPHPITQTDGVFSMQNLENWGKSIIGGLEDVSQRTGINDAVRNMKEGTLEMLDNPLKGVAQIGNGLLGFMTSPFMAGDQALRDVGAGQIADAIAYPFEQTATAYKVVKNALQGELDKVGLSDENTATILNMKGIPVTPETLRDTANEIDKLNEGLTQIAVGAGLGAGFAKFKGSPSLLETNAKYQGTKEFQKEIAQRKSEIEVPKTEPKLLPASPINTREIPREQQIATSQTKLQLTDLETKKADLNDRLKNAIGKKKTQIKSELKDVNEQIKFAKEVTGEKLNTGDIGLYNLDLTPKEKSVIGVDALKETELPEGITRTKKGAYKKGNRYISKEQANKILEEQNATEKRNVTESNQPEYQKGNESGNTTQAGDRNSPVQSGQIQEEVAPKVKDIKTDQELLNSNMPEITNFVKGKVSPEEFNKIVQDAASNPENRIPVEGKTEIDMQSGAIESAIYAKAQELVSEKPKIQDEIIPKVESDYGLKKDELSGKAVQIGDQTFTAPQSKNHNVAMQKAIDALGGDKVKEAILNDNYKVGDIVDGKFVEAGKGAPLTSKPNILKEEVKPEIKALDDRQTEELAKTKKIIEDSGIRSQKFLSEKNLTKEEAQKFSFEEKQKLQDEYKGWLEKNYPELGENPFTKAFKKAFPKMVEEAKQETGQVTLTKNKIFTEEKYAQAKKNITTKGQNLTSGIDPTLLKDYVNIAGYHFEKGARTFTEWSKKMIDEFGDTIKPHLLKLWANVKKDFEAGTIKPISKNRETIYKEAEAVTLEKASYVNKLTSLVKESKTAVDKLAKTVFEPITTSIEKVSKPLFRKFRNFSFEYQKKVLQRHGVIGDYFEAKKGIDAKTSARFNIALQNGWLDDARKMAQDNGFLMQFERAMQTKDKLAEELNVKTIKNHFPRMVQDFEGFVKFLEEKFPDYYKDNFSRMIAEKATRVGRELTFEEKANLINNALRGYNPGIGLSDLGNMKKRVIPVLDGEMSKFYYSPDEALISYVNQMTELAEARKFFGKGGFDINESIGAYIQNLREGGKLDIAGSRELMDIFKARFNQRGMTKGLNVLRDVGVITKLGNPFTALTQLKDLAYSFYFSPSRAPKEFFKSVVGKKNWEIKELGIDPLKYAEELANPKKRSKFVQSMLNYSGFSKLDMIGKETLINTLWDKYKNQAKSSKLNTEFERRIERYFGKGEEKVNVINDLKNGRKTDATAFLLYNELVGAQPISLSELPRGYLKGGNWRIAYFLKTFAIRQLDFALNETVRVMKDKSLTSAQRKQGAYNMFKLATTLALTGTAVDQVRNIAMNAFFGTKRTTITEDVVDNLLNVALTSRYDYTNAREGGLGATIGTKLIPPLDIVSDPIIYDLPNIFQEKGRTIKSTRNLPLIGKFLYEYMKNKNKRGSSGLDLNINTNLNLGL